MSDRSGQLKAIALDGLASWEADNDARVGKILMALAGLRPGYRADVDDLFRSLSTSAPIAQAPASIEDLAAAVVQRVLSVYREDYIDRCVEREPDSLLALVKRLESALSARAKRDTRCPVLGDPSDSRTRCILTKGHDLDHQCPDWERR